MRHYEIVILFDADFPEKIETFCLQFSGLIEQGKGIIHRSEDWGKRQLAYPIDKHVRAHYRLFNVEIAPETLAQLEEKFRFTDLVLRNLITKMPRAVSETSAVLKQRSERSINPVNPPNASETSIASSNDDTLKSDGTSYESDSSNDEQDEQ